MVYYLVLRLPARELSNGLIEEEFKTINLLPMNEILI